MALNFKTLGKFSKKSSLICLESEEKVFLSYIPQKRGDNLASSSSQDNRNRSSETKDTVSYYNWHVHYISCDDNLVT